MHSSILKTIKQGKAKKGKRMDEMRARFIERFFCFSGVFVVFVLTAAVPAVWGSSLRIGLTDGNSVEVPYYWEEKGQIKFETPGGVAGIPKSQVTSVQEVITSREFDPQSIIEAPATEAESSQKQKLASVVASELPKAPGQKLDNQEAARYLDRNLKGPGGAADRVHTVLFKSELDSAELDRQNGNDVVLRMRKILSSRNDLRNQAFTLTLYDGEGNVLQRQPCQLIPLNLDRKTLRELGISGHLYAVTATVKPETKFKRYEITTARR
jgi:hypothetical protein